MASGNNDAVEDQVGGRTGKLCDPCNRKGKTTPADVFCKDCKQFQCVECEKVHELYDLLSGHEIVEMSQATSVPIPEQKRQVLTVDMKGLDKCDVHGKIFEFFCVDHEKLCCSSCAIGQHRKCDEVNGLSEQVTETKLNTDDILAKMTKLQTGVAAVKQFVQKSKSNVRTQIDGIPKEIDNMKEAVIKLFDELKDKAVEEATRAEKALYSELETKLSKSEDIGNDIQKLQDKLRSVTTKGSPMQIFIVIQVLEKQIRPYEAALKEQQTNLKTIDFSIGYNEMLTTLVSTSATIGNLNIDSRTDIDNAATKPVHLTMITSLDVKQDDDAKQEPHYTGLAFLTDGRLVAVDNKNRKLCVMNDKLQKLGVYTFEKTPLSVAVISDDQVAVTRGGGYELLILHVSKSNTITLSKTLKTTSKYDSIWPMNDTTVVVSTIEDKRPVRMITVTGEERDFPGIPDKEYKVDTSASTYIRDKGIVVLTDRHNHEIYLYDFKDKFTTMCIVKDENIKEPRGVCVGPNDCIFVCSRNTNSIVQLSLTGRLVSTYNVDMNRPKVLCVSNDVSKLVVSNNTTGGRKLNLFHIK